ncbi:MAG TPA: nucleoside triphosphate pyrophosphohydrolase [Thermaerobacter sp.]
MTAHDTGMNRDHGVNRLVELVRRLRAPDGCPWDRAQTHRSLRRFVIEEAYEVVEAIDAGDPRHLAEELGDLLLQVLLHAQIAAEAGHFTLADVTRALADKLIRRHPHVFGEGAAASEADVRRLWAELKRAEREGRDAGDGAGLGRGEEPPGEAGEVGEAGEAGEAISSALVQAYRLQERAAQRGLDWTDAAGARAKLAEELEELDRVVAAGDPERVEEEFGDALFALINVGRHLGVHPEVALLAANRKFNRRFRTVEELARRRGLRPEQLSPEDLDRLWEEAKAGESSRIQGPSAEQRSGIRADARGGKRG